MKSINKYYHIMWLLTAFTCLTLITVPANAQSNSLMIGTATKIINPKVDQFVQERGTKKRVPKIRDNIEANALYLSNDSTQILMVSCDVGKINPHYNDSLREAMGVAAGIFPRDVIISATHAHGGPLMGKHPYLRRSDYKKKLRGWLVDLAKEALGSARPGKIGWGTGKAQIGWNRRYTWADGTHTMHGDATRADFTGLEGPDDPQQTTLFAKDKKGKLLAILYNNTTHPQTFYRAGIFSSDFPGYARKKVRQKFDRNLPVLFLNGAQGDIQPYDPFHPHHDTKDEHVRRLGNKIFNEIMDQYAQVTSYDDDPVLKHVYKDLKVGVRLPTAQQLAKARKVVARIDAGADIHGLKRLMATQTVWLQENFGDAPFDTLPIHGIRIGGLAIVTEPTELYCQFGLNIKRRSPVKTTMVVGLTDEDHGYAPTIYGILGGGFTGRAIGVTRLESYAGYKIVETGAQLLNKLWDGYTNTYKNTGE